MLEKENFSFSCVVFLIQRQYHTNTTQPQDGILIDFALDFIIVKGNSILKQKMVIIFHVYSSLQILFDTFSVLIIEKPCGIVCSFKFVIVIFFFFFQKHNLIE